MQSVRSFIFWSSIILSPTYLKIDELFTIFEIILYEFINVKLKETGIIDEYTFYRLNGKKYDCEFVIVFLFKSEEFYCNLFYISLISYR